MKREIENNEVLNNEQPQTEKQSGIFSSEAFQNLAKTAMYMKIMSIIYFLVTFGMIIGMIIRLTEEYFSRYTIFVALLDVLLAIIVFCLGSDLWNTGKYYKNISNPTTSLSIDEETEIMENAIYVQLRYWRMIIRVLIGIVVLSLLFFILGNNMY